MELLGCSGPGAGETIARSIVIGYEHATVVGGLLAVSLCLWAFALSKGLYPGIYTGLLLLHPAWTISAIYGDCGFLKRDQSWVFTGIGCTVLLFQVGAVVLACMQGRGREEHP